jgi:ribosomal protein S1
MPANYKPRADISTLEGMDLSSKKFSATVISSHDFGVFAELDEFGVEGLLPASKLGGATFAAGSTIEVQIAEMNVGDKKLVLSFPESRPDVSALDSQGSSRWVEGIVESVSVSDAMV